jgi:hypothetical protein
MVGEEVSDEEVKNKFQKVEKILDKHTKVC